MTDDATRRWLDATWTFVRAALPPAPARALEVGCGPAGGFVPALRAAGYDAVGVDPAAPAGPGFHQVEFEHWTPPAPADVVVACTSLHHVDDLDHMVDRIAAATRPGGTLVVVEWAHERFDERTARWCFDRLPPGEGWLHHHRQRWRDSGVPWTAYLDDWVAAEGLHRADAIVAALGRQFRARSLVAAPYFFADLGITEAAERAAGIALTGLRWVGSAEQAVDRRDLAVQGARDALAPVDLDDRRGAGGAGLDGRDGRADHAHRLVPGLALDGGEHGIGAVGQAGRADDPDGLGDELADGLAGAQRGHAERHQD
ncbi:hypothetical protein Asi02nite_44450 [Asanoa siamensis]|uniref:Methyltransferase family protein n=1 Tax=Asanoa siamensis TaxID=926357 RepID=A0ABQ4CUH4_9ACTN|nr:hypothetical protein Asi02nite_44450 [Asanoa siamensis]